jgi:hypothetical protein
VVNLYKKNHPFQHFDFQEGVRIVNTRHTANTGKKHIHF